MTDRAQLRNDQEDALRIMLDGRQVTLWCAIPCIVQSINFTQMTVSAQPTIQGNVENEDGTIQSVNLPLLIHVPLVFPGAGGFMITFPVAIEDEVLVVFASRCIDAWWQSGGIQRPMEARMHDLSDGFAIPGPKSLPNVFPAISTTAVQIRNKLGTSYVEIAADGKIKLVSPTEIDLTAPALVITGNVTVTGTLGCGVLSPASVSTSGAIAAGSVSAGGVDLETHIHSGVTVGSGDTGVPV